MKTETCETPTPQPAATLILVKEAQGELQTYLLKRSAASGFMAGLYVFPGGTVAAQDRDDALWPHPADIESDEIACTLADDMPPADAAAFAVAAIRECLEEAGVFLAERNAQSAEDFKRAAALAQSLSRPDGWMREMVTGEGWRLQFSRLYPWSHWITPALMKKRFDTRFFMAAMPPMQTCRPDGCETVAGVWVNPLQALSDNLRGDLPLSPPTLVSLQQLLPYRGLGELLAAARSRGWGAPIEPRLIPLDGGALILEPWDPAYRMPGIAITKPLPPPGVLAAGEPFSRLWFSNGLWRPVAVC